MQAINVLRRISSVNMQGLANKFTRSFDLIMAVVVVITPLIVLFMMLGVPSGRPLNSTDSESNSPFSSILQEKNVTGVSDS